MEDYYKVLGTSRYAVEYDVMNNNKRRTEEEQDKFLKMKYQDKLKMIKRSKDIARARRDQNKLKELEGEEQKLIFAYQKISSATLRKEYHNEIEGKKEKIVAIYKRESPYEVLNINKEDLEKYTNEEINKIIEKNRKDLITQYSTELDSIPFKFFSKRMKVERIIKEVEEAYELISTVDKRKEYEEQEQKEKYSHANEYNPYLINDISNSDHKSLQGKIVRREEALSREYSYDDEENRQLRIKQTGVIRFQNWTGVVNLFVNEYKVTRVIDGQEVVDIVYANLPSIDLSRINEKEEPIDPDYYNCFINKLLAEDTIEASRSNGGFIGGIERDKKGYYITLEKKDLLPMEQEQMTAVMIWKQREEEIKKEGDEQSK